MPSSIVIEQTPLRLENEHGIPVNHIRLFGQPAMVANRACHHRDSLDHRFVKLCLALGHSAPPNPNPLECTLEATHIKIDADTAEVGDDIDIRKDALTDLQHKGKGKGVGEFVRGRDFQEPACYVTAVTVKIKVRFTVQPTTVKWLTVRAKPSDAKMPDVLEKEIEFANGTSTETTGGKISEYITMELGKPFDAKIDKIQTNWSWEAKNPLDAQRQPTGQQNIWQELDRSDGLVVYTVLGPGKPGSPWCNPTDDSTQPWVSALEFTIEKAKTKGLTTADDAAKRIVKYCFEEHGVKYDHVSGASPSVDAGGQKVPLSGATAPGEFPNSFLFSGYMSLAASTKVGCYDQALAVQCMFRLVSGAQSYAAHIKPGGYINKCTLVGGQTNCNNPFFENMKYVPTATVGDDTTVLMAVQWSDNTVRRMRSFFGTHAFVVRGQTGSDGPVLDATAGPHEGGASSATKATYCTTVFDTTTDDEKKAVTVDAQGNFIVDANNEFAKSSNITYGGFKIR